MPNVNEFDAHGQPVFARRVRQQAVAFEILDERHPRARVADLDRGQQNPGQNLRALREMVEGVFLRGRQPVAVVRDNRRISLTEPDLHRDVEQTADHRYRIEDGGEKIETNDGHEHKANEPHSGLLLRGRERRGLVGTTHLRALQATATARLRNWWPRRRRPQEQLEGGEQRL